MDISSLGFHGTKEGGCVGLQESKVECVVGIIHTLGLAVATPPDTGASRGRGHGKCHDQAKGYYGREHGVAKTQGCGTYDSKSQTYIWFLFCNNVMLAR